MKYQVNNGNMILGKFLQQCCGIDIKNPFDMIITTLRSLIVAEWLGEYSNEYKEFMTGNQLQEQASDFLHSGEFASNVGDLVIAAISNILKAPIVVFTSVKNMPVVIQHPTHSPTLNMDPIFLAYNQFGSGHYTVLLCLQFKQIRSCKKVLLQQRRLNVAVKNSDLKVVTVAGNQ